MGRERLVRLQIMLDNAELEAIETWRFQTRMPSRAAAVRELMRRGLAAEGFKVAAHWRPVGKLRRDQLTCCRRRSLSPDLLRLLIMRSCCLMRGIST